MKTGATKHGPRYGHLLVMFGLFLSFITVAIQGVNAPRTIAFGTGEIANISNQYRANAGLPALALNSQLTSSAQAKADHMAANSYFAHDAPDGTSPWYFFDSVGYSYSTAGENLALTNQDAASVVKGWYDSTGHRANMFSPSFTEVGYGISFVASFTYKDVLYNNVYLVAAHYALPTSSIPQVPVAPLSTGNPPSEPQTPTVKPAENPVETVAEAPRASGNNEAVAGNIDTENGTSTSGTLAVASRPQPKISADVAHIGLGIGITLVIIGSAIEIRRFIKHLPLIPHLHG